MYARRRYLAALAVVISFFQAVAFASDDDGQPDAHSFDLDLAASYGGTIVFHAWDTLTFTNGGAEDMTLTFLMNGEEPLPNEPQNMNATRERGTYWDGVDLLNSGKLAPGASYWVTMLEGGTYTAYNILNPEQRTRLVAVPEGRHIPAEGVLLDDAAIAADPVLVELIEEFK